MKKTLYDKVNKREARILWFTDQNGNIWIDADPQGISMNGSMRINFLKEDHPRYEIREVK